MKRIILTEDLLIYMKTADINELKDFKEQLNIIAEMYRV